MNNRMAVIGIGNPLRRDDGIGIAVLDSLVKFYKREGIDYLNFGIASFDLINRMHDYEAVVLIDAINGNLAVGEVKIFELKEIEYNIENSAVSTHELDLKSIFELSRGLALKTKVYVVGIQAVDISWTEGLSGTLKNRKGGIVRQISEFIDKNFNKNLGIPSEKIYG